MSKYLKFSAAFVAFCLFTIGFYSTTQLLSAQNTTAANQPAQVVGSGNLSGEINTILKGRNMYELSQAELSQVVLALQSVLAKMMADLGNVSNYFGAPGIGGNTGVPSTRPPVTVPPVTTPAVHPEGEQYVWRMGTEQGQASDIRGVNAVKGKETIECPDYLPKTAKPWYPINSNYGGIVPFPYILQDWRSHPYRLSGSDITSNISYKISGLVDEGTTGHWNSSGRERSLPFFGTLDHAPAAGGVNNREALATYSNNPDDPYGNDVWLDMRPYSSISLCPHDFGYENGKYLPEGGLEYCVADGDNGDGGPQGISFVIVDADFDVSQLELFRLGSGTCVLRRGTVYYANATAFEHVDPTNDKKLTPGARCQVKRVGTNEVLDENPWCAFSVLGSAG